ncbi:hypothetical protein Y032_0502g2625 [Ancylostoma ceylanicum]|uniref:Uncharacterized protein n=1 Tax=Ancylostoma ceylanicum TaxID=53326 RepID=A0A016WVV3_9BILA|nr:hypothetical protein Y032_0502g2625 [Ancylostoma ceylanicum]
MFTLHIFEVLIFTTTLLIIKCTRATASRAGSDRTKESKGENAKKTLDGKLSGSHSTMSRSKKDRSNEQPRLISGKNKLSSEAIKRKMQHVEFDLKKKATETTVWIKNYCTNRSPRTLPSKTFGHPSAGHALTLVVSWEVGTPTLRLDRSKPA